MCNMSSYTQIIEANLQSQFYIPKELINLIFEFIGTNEFSRLLFWQFLEVYQKNIVASYTLLYYSRCAVCTHFRPFFRIKTTNIKNAMMHWLHTKQFVILFNGKSKKYRYRYYENAIKRGLLNKKYPFCGNKVDKITIDNHINMRFLKSHEFTLEEIDRCFQYLYMDNIENGAWVWMIKYENNTRDIIRLGDSLFEKQYLVY